jgi:hypothetical protein
VVEALAARSGAGANWTKEQAAAIVPGNQIAFKELA